MYSEKNRFVGAATAAPTFVTTASPSPVTAAVNPATDARQLRFIRTPLPLAPDGPSPWFRAP